MANDDQYFLTRAATDQDQVLILSRAEYRQWWYGFAYGIVFAAGGFAAVLWWIAP